MGEPNYPSAELRYFGKIYWLSALLELLGCHVRVGENGLRWPIGATSAARKCNCVA